MSEKGSLGLGFVKSTCRGKVKLSKYGLLQIDTYTIGL